MNQKPGVAHSGGLNQYTCCSHEYELWCIVATHIYIWKDGAIAVQKGLKTEDMDATMGT